MGSPGDGLWLYKPRAKSPSRGVVTDGEWWPRSQVGPNRLSLHIFCVASGLLSVSDEAIVKIDLELFFSANINNITFQDT